MRICSSSALLLGWPMVALQDLAWLVLLFSVHCGATPSPGVFHFNVAAHKLRRDLGKNSSVAVEADAELLCGGEVFRLEEVLRHPNGEAAYGTQGVAVVASHHGRSDFIAKLFWRQQPMCHAHECELPPEETCSKLKAMKNVSGLPTCVAVCKSRGNKVMVMERVGGPEQEPVSIRAGSFGQSLLDVGMPTASIREVERQIMWVMAGMCVQHIVSSDVGQELLLTEAESGEPRVTLVDVDNLREVDPERLEEHGQRCRVKNFMHAMLSTLPLRSHSWIQCLLQEGCEVSNDAEDDALAQHLRHLAPGYLEVALEVLGTVAFRDSDEDFCELPVDQVCRPSCPVEHDGECYDDESGHNMEADASMDWEDNIDLVDSGRRLQTYACGHSCWCCQTGGGRRRRRLLTCAYLSTCACTGLPANAAWTSTGSAGVDNCQWACASGYELNQAGTGCDRITTTTSTTSTSTVKTSTVSSTTRTSSTSTSSVSTSSITSESSTSSATSSLTTTSTPSTSSSVSSSSSTSSGSTRSSSRSSSSTSSSTSSLSTVSSGSSSSSRSTSSSASSISTVSSRSSRSTSSSAPSKSTVSSGSSRSSRSTSSSASSISTLSTGSMSSQTTVSSSSSSTTSTSSASSSSSSTSTLSSGSMSSSPTSMSTPGLSSMSSWTSLSSSTSSSSIASISTHTNVSSKSTSSASSLSMSTLRPWTTTSSSSTSATSTSSLPSSSTSASSALTETLSSTSLTSTVSAPASSLRTLPSQPTSSSASKSSSASSSSTSSSSLISTHTTSTTKTFGSTFSSFLSLSSSSSSQSASSSSQTETSSLATTTLSRSTLPSSSSTSTATSVTRASSPTSSTTPSTSSVTSASSLTSTTSGRTSQSQTTSLTSTTLSHSTMSPSTAVSVTSSSSSISQTRTSVSTSTESSVSTLSGSFASSVTSSTTLTSECADVAMAFVLTLTLGDDAASYVDIMTEAIAGALGIDASCVEVSAVGDEEARRLSAGMNATNVQLQGTIAAEGSHSSIEVILQSQAFENYVCASLGQQTCAVINASVAPFPEMKSVSTSGVTNDSVAVIADDDDDAFEEYLEAAIIAVIVILVIAAGIAAFVWKKRSKKDSMTPKDDPGTGIATASPGSGSGAAPGAEDAPFIPGSEIAPAGSPAPSTPGSGVPVGSGAAPASPGSGPGATAGSDSEVAPHSILGSGARASPVLGIASPGSGAAACSAPATPVSPEGCSSTHSVATRPPSTSLPASSPRSQTEAASQPASPQHVYLSLRAGREDMFVCVTSSFETLASACSAKNLALPKRAPLLGHIGEVLMLEQMDDFGWVAFRAQGLQGWFPLACLREVVDIPGLSPHAGELSKPDTEMIMEMDMISLAVESASGVSLASATLPLATTDRSRTTTGSGKLLRHLELDEKAKGLGKGGFGQVTKGNLYRLDLRGFDKVAVKRPLQRAGMSERVKMYREEAAITAKMALPCGSPHPFVVCVLAFCPEICGIVMELCDFNLKQFRRLRALSAHQQLELMQQACSGCFWMSLKGCVHCDLKMENILIAKLSNQKFVAKVSDFGLAMLKKRDSRDVYGTEGYIAPEAYHAECTEKSDVYSIGQVMLRTFCPGRIVTVDTAERIARQNGILPDAAAREVEPLSSKVASWVAQEWRKTDRKWISPAPPLPKVCQDVGLLVAQALDYDAGLRPEFGTLTKELKEVVDAVEYLSREEEEEEEEDEEGEEDEGEEEVMGEIVSTADHLSQEEAGEIAPMELLHC